MKKLLKVLPVVLIAALVLALLSITAIAVYAAPPLPVCPGTGGGWTRVNNGHWTPVTGATNYCFKFGNGAAPGDPGSQCVPEAALYGTGYPGATPAGRCNLTHWSYYVPPAPQCGPDEWTTDEGCIPKTHICHATGSGTNPFQLTAPVNIGVLMGHVGLSHQNGEDIIPPIPYYVPAGQNWDTVGQAIWENGCEIPEPPHDYELVFDYRNECEDNNYYRIMLTDFGQYVSTLYHSGFFTWSDQYTLGSETFGPFDLGEFGTFPAVTLDEPADCQIFKTYKKHQAYLADNCEGIQRVVNLYEGPASDPYQTFVGTHYNVTTLFTDPFTLETIPAQFVDIPDAYGSDYTFPAMVEPEKCLPEPEECGRCSNAFVGWVEWVDRDRGCDDDFYNERVEYPFDTRCYGTCQATVSLGKVYDNPVDGAIAWGPWQNDLNGKKYHYGVQTVTQSWTETFVDYNLRELVCFIKDGVDEAGKEVYEEKCAPRWTGEWIITILQKKGGKHFRKYCTPYVPDAADTNGDGRISQKEAEAWEWSDAYLAQLCPLKCETKDWEKEKVLYVKREFKTCDNRLVSGNHCTTDVVPGDVCAMLEAIRNGTAGP